MTPYMALLVVIVALLVLTAVTDNGCYRKCGPRELCFLFLTLLLVGVCIGQGLKEESCNPANTTVQENQ